jgi:hypothetical protein
MFFKGMEYLLTSLNFINKDTTKYTDSSISNIISVIKDQLSIHNNLNLTIFRFNLSDGHLQKYEIYYNEGGCKLFLKLGEYEDHEIMFEAGPFKWKKIIKLSKFYNDKIIDELDELKNYITSHNWVECKLH